jgi:hypothetical protein
MDSQWKHSLRRFPEDDDDARNRVLRNRRRKAASRSREVTPRAIRDAEYGAYTASTRTVTKRERERVTRKYATPSRSARDLYSEEEDDEELARTVAAMRAELRALRSHLVETNREILEHERREEERRRRKEREREREREKERDRITTVSTRTVLDEAELTSRANNNNANTSSRVEAVYQQSSSSRRRREVLSSPVRSSSPPPARAASPSLTTVREIARLQRLNELDFQKSRATQAARATTTTSAAAALKGSSSPSARTSLLLAEDYGVGKVCEVCGHRNCPYNASAQLSDHALHIHSTHQ